MVKEMIEGYEVLKISAKIAKEWILNKHYAKRRCCVSYAFGLFKNDILVGICTFGYPPNYNFNNGGCVFNNLNVLTLELNRLVTNDGLDKNALSFFVVRALKQLPRPSCIVSYADPNAGHYGYIYQATNWIYTGNSTPKLQYTFKDGSVFDIHRRIDKKIKEHGEIIKKTKLIPTQRYLFFNGNKPDKRKMMKHLKMKILLYPKGVNKKYDASYKCSYVCKKDVKI